MIGARTIFFRVNTAGACLLLFAFYDRHPRQEPFFSNYGVLARTSFYDWLVSRAGQAREANGSGTPVLCSAGQPHTPAHRHSRVLEDCGNLLRW